MSKQVPTINPEWLVGITMTKEQKYTWLAALRSGEYKQGKGRLSDEESQSFCCMGVAEDQGLAMRGSPYYLCDFLGSRLQEVLGSLNDEGFGDDNPDPWTFAEIADFIEAHIPACDEKL